MSRKDTYLGPQCPLTSLLPICGAKLNITLSSRGGWVARSCLISNYPKPGVKNGILGYLLHRKRQEAPWSRTRSQTARTSDCWYFLPGAAALSTWSIVDWPHLLQSMHTAERRPRKRSVCVVVSISKLLWALMTNYLKRSRLSRLGQLSTLVHIARSLGRGWTSRQIQVSGQAAISTSGTVLVFSMACSVRCM